MVARIQHVDIDIVDVGARIPALQPGELHLWIERLDPPPSPREISAAAHGRAVRLLQQYAGTEAPPTLVRNEHGKPLAEGSGYPFFNISHAGPLLALAFARDAEMGVDIESRARVTASSELAARFFTASEAAHLARLDQALRAESFLRLWTCKEAVLKAMGQGLSFGLDRVAFELDEKAWPHALMHVVEAKGCVDDWQLRHFNVDDEHVGSLAWRGEPLGLRVMRGEPT